MKASGQISADYALWATEDLFSKNALRKRHPNPGQTQEAQPATPRHPNNTGWAPTAVPGRPACTEEHLWGSFLFLHRGCRRSCSNERKTGEEGREENPSFSGD